MLFSRKTLFLSFFLAFVIFSVISHTASASQLKNNLMVNLLGVATGNYGPEYEIALGNHFGLGIRANIIPIWEAKGGKSSSDDDYDWIYSVSGYGAGISGRFYPFGAAPKGFHLGPRFDFIGFSGTYEDRAHNEAPVDTNVLIGTAHLEAGYKFIIAQRVVLGLFVNGGYVTAQAPDASELLALAYIVGGGIYLGIAF
ncbi:hypothetical protein K8S19_02360 [bacterium]|nr:hypothetical protein [bacterium]